MVILVQFYGTNLGIFYSNNAFDFMSFLAW